MTVARSRLSLTPLHQLLRGVQRRRLAPPVRLMEEVLRRDPAEAVPAVVAALQDAYGAPWPALWLVVLAGELRDPAALGILARDLGHVQHPDPWLAQAAAEALTKIGEPALDVLHGHTRSDVGLCRLYAYAGLGWMGTPAACAALLDALPRERGMVDALAAALGDAACESAIEPLVDALPRCLPFQRSEIERQIVRLHRREGPFTPTALDWRLRYRPVGRRPFAAGWPGRLRSVRDDPRWRAMRMEGPSPRPLETILAEAELSEERRAADAGTQADAAHADPDDVEVENDRHDEPEEGAASDRAGAGSAVLAPDDPFGRGSGFTEELARALEVADEHAGGTGDIFVVLGHLDRMLSLSSVAGVPLLGDGSPGPDKYIPWNPAYEPHPWTEQRYRLLAGEAPSGPAPASRALVEWRGGAVDAPTYDDLQEDDPTRTMNPAQWATRLACHWLVAQGCEDVKEGVERLRRRATRARWIEGEGRGNGGESQRGPDAGPDAESDAESEPNPTRDLREIRIRKALDRYYREWMDRPLDVLDGLSPQNAKEEHHGVLLTFIEGFEAAEAERLQAGDLAYDFGWLRRELGLDEVREGDS